MASTADPSWRCQADLTGGVPVWGLMYNMIKSCTQQRPQCPYCSMGINKLHGQGKAYPLPASLPSEMRLSIQSHSSHLFVYCARNECLSEHGLISVVCSGMAQEVFMMPGHDWVPQCLDRSCITCDVLWCLAVAFCNHETHHFL